MHPPVIGRKRWTVPIGRFERGKRHVELTRASGAFRAEANDDGELVAEGLGPVRLPSSLG